MFSLILCFQASIQNCGSSKRLCVSLPIGLPGSRGCQSTGQGLENPAPLAGSEKAQALPAWAGSRLQSKPRDAAETKDLEKSGGAQ